MVSRSEIDLLDIRQEFRKNFAKSLHQMIQVKLLFCCQGKRVIEMSLFPLFIFMGEWEGADVSRAGQHSAL